MGLLDLLLRGQPEPEKRQTQAIWVCVGQPCRELGSRNILGRVREAIKRRRLRDRVRVREAACLALCGAGPNVKVWPDRVRYWEVQPGSVDPIIDRHFGANPPPAPEAPGGEGRVARAPVES